ncbi:MAG: preprotein translocase subunit YajC [Candidatus Omnitrophica bacterium]|nr:preprotein translocase subunit YajC [Candidatus Omnitrophota bacterium]
MSGQSNFLMQLVPMILVGGIFYLLVFMPEQKKQKEHKTMVDGLKKNDEVTTAGGIHGTVVMVKEKTVVLRLDENCRVEFDKEAVLVLAKKSE